MRPGGIPQKLLTLLQDLGISRDDAPSLEKWRKFLDRVEYPPLDEDAALARSAHDLRGALTVVLGASELLLESRLDLPQRQAAQSIERAALELRQTFGKLLQDTSPSEPPTHERLSSPPRLEKLADARVLVIDDNEYTRVLIERTLSQLGVKTDIVEGGRDGVRQFSKGIYDLVLCDCHMPEMDGFEVVRLMRGLMQHGRRVPLIAISATITQEFRKKCQNVGFDDFLAKPFTLEKLRNAVTRWLLLLHRGALKPRAFSLPPPRLSSSIPPPPAPIVLSDEAALCIDMTRLNDLAVESGTNQIVLELSRIFVDDIKVRIEQLAESIRANQIASMRTHAHAVKGAAANFGAIRMARQAEAIEQAKDPINMLELVKATDVLRDEYVQVCKNLDTHVFGLDTQTLATPSQDAN